MVEPAQGMVERKAVVAAAIAAWEEVYMCMIVAEVVVVVEID